MQVGQEQPEVGQRFDCNGDHGFIIWRGPVTVKGNTDVWLGVQWDDPMRGKSDGSVEGRCIPPPF